MLLLLLSRVARLSRRAAHHWLLLRVVLGLLAIWLLPVRLLRRWRVVAAVLRHALRLALEAVSVSDEATAVEVGKTLID
jgi:hypothetical protein